MSVAHLGRSAGFKGEQVRIPKTLTANRRQRGLAQLSRVSQYDCAAVGVRSGNGLASNLTQKRPRFPRCP